MDPSVHCFSILAVLLFCGLQCWLALRCDVINGIRPVSLVEWNANGTGIRSRSHFVFQGCSNIFRFSYSSARWNTTAVQSPGNPVPSFPVTTQGLTEGPSKTEEPETPIPDLKPTLAPNKSRLNAYERSLLAKAALRKSFLQKWIEEQEQLSHQPFNESKFIIYTPIGYGLGNCLSILSEAIMFSWITHRRFLIYRYPSFSYYFSLPLKDYMIDRSNTTFSSMVKKTPSCRGDIKDLKSFSSQFVVVRGSCKILDFVATSDDFFDFLNDNGFILNPKKRSLNEIRKMIYFFMYSEVIHIKPHVQALIDQTKKQLRWDAFYWIGVQVRTGHMPGDEDLNVFLMRNDIDVFEKVAMNRTRVAQVTQKKPVKWLLATDNVKIRDRIMKSRPEYIISANCTIRHSLRDILSDKESEGMLCTLLDNYLLSSCNELVLTLRSTYGLLAANRKMDIPSIFVRRGDAQRKVFS